MARPAPPTYLLIIFAAFFASVGICHGQPSTVEVTATILSNHNCSFDKKATPAALNFGDLDPFSNATVVRTDTISFECKGNKNNPVGFGVSDNGGLHSGHRMKHDSHNIFIPYSFEISPTGGSTEIKTTVELNITGTVYGPDYRMAYEGSYTDTVTIFINP